MPAMTTMDSASMMTWLTPAMIVGSASGSWTRAGCAAGGVPNASAASTSLRVDLPDAQLGHAHARGQREDQGGDDAGHHAECRRTRSPGSGRRTRASSA